MTRVVRSWNVRIVRWGVGFRDMVEGRVESLVGRLDIVVVSVGWCYLMFVFADFVGGRKIW